MWFTNCNKLVIVVCELESFLERRVHGSYQKGAYGRAGIGKLEMELWLFSHVLCIQGHMEEQEIEVDWRLEMENRKTEREMELQPLCCHSLACYICILEAFCSYTSKFFIT